MAQETAGTIGIPVLKNEILPYLSDFNKRRERQAYLEAKNKQKQAELDAKKLEFAPPGLPGTEAGFGAPLIDSRRSEQLKRLEDMAKSGASQGEILKEARTFISEDESLNSVNKRLTSEIKDESKRLRELGINATPQKEEQYFAEARKDPQFWAKDHQTGFSQWLLSRPQENINPSIIGGLMRKDVGKIKTTYENPKGETETFEYEKLFEPTEDNIPGKPDLKIIRANKINVQEARNLFAKRNDLKVLADSWITDKKKELSLTPEFQMMPDDEKKNQLLEDKATNEFFSAAFPLAGNEVIGLRREQGRKSGGAGKQKYGDINVGVQSIGYSTITAPSKAYRAIKPDDESKYNRVQGEAPVISVSPAEEGKLDISLPTGTNYIDISGTPVEVAGTGTNKGSKQNPIMVGVEASYPTGYKSLQNGAQLVGPSIGYVAQAKEDIAFPDGSFVRKGGIINPGLYPNIKADQVNLLPGVFGSTKELQYKMAPNMVGGQYVSPNVIAQKIFVPQNRVPDFFNNADAIMKERGLNLNTELNKLKSQYMGMFGGTKATAKTTATATKTSTAINSKLPGWTGGSQATTPSK
jgi:hypothetical protein